MGNFVSQPDTNDSNSNTNTNNNQNTQPNVQDNVVKKALLIGINYTGTDNELSGCINDSENLRGFLKEKNYFVDDEMTSMTDNSADNLKPTKENILFQLDKLCEFANDNKDKEVFLFLSYSGHGYFLTDLTGDEEDGQDEVLCPIDCDYVGYITDDELKANLVDKLPKNVKLCILIDSCHSGTMLDLKYDFKVDNQCTYVTKDKLQDSECDVIMISGCQDFDVSSDAYIKENAWRYEYQGAMTASFIKNFYDEISYEELINKMRQWLIENEFTQVPQLSSGKYIDIKKPCLLSHFDD